MTSISDQNFFKEVDQLMRDEVISLKRFCWKKWAKCKSTQSWVAEKGILYSKGYGNRKKVLLFWVEDLPYLPVYTVGWLKMF